MIRRPLVGLALSSLAFAGISPALAEDDNPIVFNHISAAYLYSDLDGADGQGYGLDLNFGLSENLFVDVAYNSRRLDAGGSDPDLEFFSGGLGLNFPLGEAKRTQLFAGLSWEQLDFRTGSASGEGSAGGDGGDSGGGGGFCTGTPLDLLTGCESASPQTQIQSKALSTDGQNLRLDGLGLMFGVRKRFGDNIEAGLRLSHRDYDEYDDTVLQLAANYAFAKNWEALIRFERYQDLELQELSAGVRYLFGRAKPGASVW